MFEKDDSTYTCDDINNLAETLRRHYQEKRNWWDTIRSIFSTMICKDCGTMFILHKYPGSWTGYKCPHCMEEAGEYADKNDFTQNYIDFIYDNYMYIIDALRKAINQAKVETVILQAVSRT